MNGPRAAAQGVAVDHDPFAEASLARVVPTTEPQREVWLACQLGTEASLAYNESVSLHLSGPLDLPALCGALQDLLDRHDALRATVSADGQSLYLADALVLDVTVVDLGHMAPNAQHVAQGEARSRAVKLPFDLEHGPLLRAELLIANPADHLLVLSAHHIVCDGWSFGVLVTELPKLYARRTGQATELLPDADSFADYAVEQLDDAHSSARDADTAYWVSVHDASAPVLELPTDRPRKPVRSFASQRADATLDAALVAAARKLGAAQGASLFVTLFALFSALLARLSGSEEVVVGVPAAGQAAEGASSLVGHCVNLLPIRLPVDIEQSLPSLLRSSHTRVLDAYEHQHCTFGTLLKKLQLPRDPGRLPLVSVLFNLDSNIAADALAIDGLQVDLMSNPRHFENFDLYLNASQIAGAVVLECQYNTDLFDAATVQRWLALYRVAIERAVAGADTPLALLFAPTVAETRQLAEFNRTSAPWAQDMRIEALIAKQVAATPGRIAVTAGGRNLSYRELDARANGLAEGLRAMGVGPGSLIGLACGRNEHMLVGLVGILKAGAGYIPLDPAFPADRLEFMAADAGLRHVVTDRSVGEGLKLRHAERLFVDELGSRTEGPTPLGSAADVAYVIYTSGSTGRPKGVLVPHHSVTNLLASVSQKPGMKLGNTVLSVTTLSFDIAVSEVILPLTVGARIVVADREQATDGDRLRALIESEQVDFIDATPSTWRLLLAAGWKGSSGMKAICTGEPLPPDLGRELLPLVGELWNGYGPTETTVWSSFHKVEVIDGPVPIGQPVANTDFHVLDAQLRPVPLGVVGELFIGGAGVTLGYLGRPEMTAERFLRDPFGTDGSKHLYKTGDLGRWRADGVLECLGRSDHQVKVRGYRIELGEIEASLLTHPDLSRVLVVTREDRPGDVRLVAYVVALPGASVDLATMQSHLRKTLPDYMVPQHLVRIDAIPLLPNGKIDRLSLPRPERQADAAVDSPRAPRTPLERQVLAAMEEVLNLPGLGVLDDFFVLGGHSLLAARLTARLSKELGINLPMRTVFEAPTVEGLALAVKGASAVGAPQRPVIEHRTDQREGPLTVMQERIRFMEELYPGRVVYNTPSAHRLTGALQRPAFEQALRQMVQHQPALRTVIAPGIEGPVQRVLDDLDVALPFEDLQGIPEADREAELMRRLQVIIDQPIDIHIAPLFRVALYRMAPDQHVFLFMPHHIVWDGWCFDLLYQEMAALYPAALLPQPVSLLVPAVTYLDYSHWHARWMESDECRAQVQFWKQRYAPVDALRALPTDRPRSAGMSGTGAVEWVHVEKGSTERLREVALQYGATLNMLVMAVYAAMMSEALGTRSLVLGIPVRGRLISEVESVMGFFNNLLPTPMEVDFNLSMRAWTGVVKRELLDSFAHQDVPFERLAGEPEIAAHAGKAGLYQSLFSFQDTRERERNWGPLTHQSVLVMQKGATEDFGFWLMEVPGGLEGGINYNSDLFDAATAQVFRERLVALLQRVATAPELSVAALLALPGQDTERFGSWVQARQRGAASPSPLPGSEYTASGTKSPSESRLASIWARLLGIDAAQISPHDNFFDIGGNSLLVMQAVAASETDVAPRIDPRRYVYENLQQLSGPVQSVKGADAQAAAVRQVPEPSGLLSRVLGRFGRRA